MLRLLAVLLHLLVLLLTFKVSKDLVELGLHFLYLCVVVAIFVILLLR